MSRERNTESRRLAHRPRWPWFDLLGGLAVAAFVAVVVVDYANLRRPREEVSLHVDPEDLAAGFREGVQWFGLYRGTEKVGFSRTERRRLDEGYWLAHRIRVRPRGDGPALDLHVETVLDESFGLRTFTVEVEGAAMPLRAQGQLRGDSLHIEAEGLPGLPSLDLPLKEPPVFDFGLGPLVMRADLQPGDRFSFTHVDPITLTPRQGTIEFIGREPLDVLGEQTSAFALRQQIEGLPPLRIWVNELGEILQQQLPLELLAVREAEAEATYGLAAPTEPTESP